MGIAQSLRKKSNCSYPLCPTYPVCPDSGICSRGFVWLGSFLSIGIGAIGMYKSKETQTDELVRQQSASDQIAIKKSEKWVLDPGPYYSTACEGIYRWHDENGTPTKFIYRVWIGGNAYIPHVISLHPKTIIHHVTEEKS